MSAERPPLALPVLATGTLAGIVASMQCLCWSASLPAGIYAVRWAARVRGGRLSGGQSLLVGLGTGMVLGGLAGTLGTALFLSQFDPAALEESMRLTESMLGNAEEVSRGTIALGFSMLAFWTNLFLGLVGGLLGAASQPAASPEPEPEPARFRFEPPPGWSPEPAAPEAPERGDVSRDSVPPEAFASAWTSQAAGGRPLPAAPQPPPDDEDSAAPLDPDEEERPTLDVEAPSKEEP